MNDTDQGGQTPLNPALVGRDETTHDLSPTPSPVETASAREGEGEGWPWVWLVVALAGVVFALYLLL